MFECRHLYIRCICWWILPARVMCVHVYCIIFNSIIKVNSSQHCDMYTPTHTDRTYWLLPRMHCDWSPGPDSFGPHTHSCHHRACSVVHGRCVGRRGTRWAAASGGSGGCRGRSQHAPHLCTIPLWGLDGPLPYSWEWLVPLWTQWGQRGAPQCGEGSPPGEDETLEGNKRVKTPVKVIVIIFTHT